jgi:hypothetical protein
MRANDSHLSDEELLLAADGELPLTRMNEVSEHLAACWDCRARSGQLESAISELVAVRHAALDPKLPPDIGRRALLKAHLSEQAAQSGAGGWSLFFRGLAFRRGLAITAVSALLIVLATVAVSYRLRTQSSVLKLARLPLEPSRKLTPGATRQVSLREVCSSQPEDGSARVIPVSVQREVFQEYGMDGAPPKDFEVDFLITPELGGSNDIHNLWPEPYYSTVWNARVKDELEDRLHEMVCNGELDLGTAQRDISTDWIVAYKKYFHTDRPL